MLRYITSGVQGEEQHPPRHLDVCDLRKRIESANHQGRLVRGDNFQLYFISFLSIVTLY